MTRYTEDDLKTFNTFRKAYPGKKRGNETEFQLFIKHKDWKTVLPNLSKFLTHQLQLRQKLQDDGKWIPQLQHIKTYIGQRSWEIDNDDDDDFQTNKPTAPLKSPQQIHEEKLQERRDENERNFKAYGKYKYTEEQLNEPYKDVENNIAVIANNVTSE